MEPHVANNRKSQKATTFKQAQNFERRVRAFLQSVGFSDVSGGVDFRLGNSSQIDACGGAGQVLVVIDAHSAVEQRRVSVRNKIKALRGDRPLILRGMRRNRRYKKYRELRLVVAGRGFKITRADRRFASIHPRVYLWDDQVLAYYSKLARLAGAFAKNDLLGEMDVKVQSTVQKRTLTTPAIRTTLRGRLAYLFFAKPEVLLAISYVARREKGKEQHYQRLVDPDRLLQIGAFLNDKRKRGFFANNIILNFQSRLTFKPFPGASNRPGLQLGHLRLPTSFRAAWIIDGQHRLYGFTRAAKHAHALQLPVIAFQQLNQTKQAELFLEINRNQKAVPPNLIWDLEGEINPNSQLGVISNAVKMLNHSHPLAGMISVPHEGPSGRRHLKLGNICDGILDRRLAEEQTESMKAHSRNPLYDTRGAGRAHKLFGALREYFSLCASILRSDWSKKREGFFCTNNGLNVLLRVYEACLAHYGHKPSRAELNRVLHVVQRWLRETYPTSARLEELRKSTSSEGGRADVSNKILAAVEDRLSLKGLAPASTRLPDLALRAAQLERDLAKFIATAMKGEFGPQWTRTRIPQDVHQRLQARRGASAKPVHHFLTLGECMLIVLREDNWADPFANVFTPAFRGKESFRVKLEELLTIRNSAAHRPNEVTPHDRQAFDLYEADIRSCMRSYRRSRGKRKAASDSTAS